MNRKLTGLFAAATLLMSGAALAQADQKDRPGTPKGQSQEQMKAGMQHELSGEVVKVDENTLYLRHMGAIVPIELNSSTRFTELEKQDLKEGREVRASFTIEGETTNLAKEIRASKAGGAKPQEYGPGAGPGMPDSP
ncbi:MAG: hypothetical protein ACYC8T_36175 [Myxococcaceae bacterium]